jgi:phosphoribosylglycinamide formyltransferase-1
VQVRRVAVLISGRGSNLQALLEACVSGRIPAAITLVVSDRADASGLERAQRFGVPAQVLSPNTFPDREAFEQALDALLQEHGIDIVCLAGWMRILGRSIVQRWEDRLLNIHPSLLPAFRGLETHERVLEAGLPVTGCTVHLVRPEVDAGPVLVQGVVPVLPGDTVASLRARVLTVEHQAYPRALEFVVRDRVRVVDGRVELRDEQPGERLLLHPLLRDWL